MSGQTIVDQSGETCFVDQAGETCFVDQAGDTLCCGTGAPLNARRRGKVDTSSIRQS